MNFELHRFEKSRIQHPGYFDEITRFYSFAIPPDQRVLELGCYTGRLLSAVKPLYGLGVDIDAEAIEIAQQLHAHNGNLNFMEADVESFDFDDIEPFDYIILSDLTPLLDDIESLLIKLHRVCKPRTRLLLNFHNNLWYPLLQTASALGYRKRHSKINWLSMQDIKNFLYISGYEPITGGTRVLFPFKLSFISSFLNRFFAKLPLINHLNLVCFIIARPKWEVHTRQAVEPSVTVVVPTLNEKGNIEGVFTRTKKMGRETELIFIDGGSTDGTVETIQHGIQKFISNWPQVRYLRQKGKGKGQAVREAFDAAQGDILMILDSDLTVPPEELPKFYRALVEAAGEMINGSRLVYPMEQNAMRFLNMIANKLFAIMFSWLLNQPIKDTLCGTKVLWKADYQKIAANRSYFKDFDPFGDFDLLFGASKLNMKIIDLPVRYRDRVYGDIKIQRWRHGWLLLKMCIVAFKKLKLS